MQFVKSYSGSGIVYLWPYSSRQAPVHEVRRHHQLANAGDAENFCVMLGGHLPSIHSLAQADHVSGVFRTLWPQYAVTLNPWVAVGLPISGTPTYNLNLWSDYSALDYPGARRQNWNSDVGVLDTTSTGQLGFRDSAWEASALAACAGG